MGCLFSSIAWLPPQASSVARILREHGFDGIEAAPGLLGMPLENVTPNYAKNVRTFWEGEGLPIKAMQALLFGKPDMRLFGSTEERKSLSDYLCLVFRVAGWLGAGSLVFGSPRNRLRNGMPEADAFSLAADFFSFLAPKAAEEGCMLCIEANAAAYGCDFITIHDEAARLAVAVNSNGFGLHIDTGVMQLNNESPGDIFSYLCTLGIMPQHIHVSEPFLSPICNKNFHSSMATALSKYGYSKNISVEMKKTESFDLIPQSAQIVKEIYGAGL